MNVGIMKLRTRAVLVTAVAGLVLSSGCGGGGSTTTPSTQTQQPVAYTIAGINEVPKANSDTNPDYSVLNGMFVERTINIPIVVGYSCSSPLPRQLDVLTTAGVGVGEEHDFLTTGAKNVKIQETKADSSPAGRITISQDKCVPGVYVVAVRKDAYLNGQAKQGTAVVFDLNLY